MSEKTIIIEQDKPFSQSRLWQAQRDYYHEQGVDAWTGAVPFYITSNPFIANAYAQLIVRFIQDWVRLHPEAVEAPFYVMELGSGSGQFSYYALLQLNKMLTMLAMDKIKLRYVMTDFTQSNVDFWAQHPSLKTFVDNGQLEFAVFDLEHPELFAHESTQNPLIVIANYLFDSIPCDIFGVNNKTLNASLVSLETPVANTRNEQVIDWEIVKPVYHDQTIEGGYYNDVALDSVLESYRNDLDVARFLFPIGSLQGLQKLRELWNDKLIVIASDKGYCLAEELEGGEYPDIDFHGSFSLMVNFDAIGRYFKQTGGDAMIHTPRGSLATAVFASGIQFDQLPEMQCAMYKYVECFSPIDYFGFYEGLEAIEDDLSLTSLASFLSLSMWDPGIYELISDRVDELIEDADSDVVDYLAKNLHHVAENFYFMPEATDLYFDLSVFYINHEDYDAALKYLDLSKQYFGENYPLYFNYGLCYHYMDEDDRALEAFERSLQFDKKGHDAKEFINKIKAAV